MEEFNISGSHSLPEDHLKTFVKKFLNSKPAEFYLREINKQPDKWQNYKMMVNID